jgi:hypothetical protein
MKNTAANAPVALLRKFADPLAPNRLPDEPLPKAAPMSAPLPCCSKTKTTTEIAADTWTTQITVSNVYSKKLTLCSTTDRNKFVRNE